MPVEAKQALEAGRLEHKEECLRLDVGLGNLRDDKDHTGAACLTIDCILSPIVLKEAESDRYLSTSLFRQAFQLLGIDNYTFAALAGSVSIKK